MAARRRVVFAAVAGSRGSHEHLMSGGRERQRELRRASSVENETKILYKDVHRGERRVIVCKMTMMTSGPAETGRLPTRKSEADAKKTVWTA
jgi:hypothetical protein